MMLMMLMRAGYLISVLITFTVTLDVLFTLWWIVRCGRCGRCGRWGRWRGWGVTLLWSWSCDYESRSLFVSLSVWRRRREWKRGSKVGIRDWGGGEGRGEEGQLTWFNLVREEGYRTVCGCVGVWVCSLDWFRCLDVWGGWGGGVCMWKKVPGDEEEGGEEGGRRGRGMREWGNEGRLLFFPFFWIIRYSVLLQTSGGLGTKLVFFWFVVVIVIVIAMVVPWTCDTMWLLGIYLHVYEYICMCMYVYTPTCTAGLSHTSSFLGELEILDVIPLYWDHLLMHAPCVCCLHI